VKSLAQNLGWSDVEVVIALADVEPLSDPQEGPAVAQRANWRKWVPSLVQIEFTLLMLIGWVCVRYYVLERLFS